MYDTLRMKARGASAPRIASRQPVAAQPTTAAEVRAHERARLKAVFASETVKGREYLAAQLLVSTNMSAETIIATLPRFRPEAVASAQAELRKLAAAGAARAAQARAAMPGASQPRANHGWPAIIAKLNKKGSN